MKAKPIQIQPDIALRKKIEAEAKAAKRRLGPHVLYILEEYFAAKASKSE